MSTLDALRLVIFDGSATTQGRQPFLVKMFELGAWFFRCCGWIDAAHSATSWQDAVDWLCSVEPARPIGEIQFWGHGLWGLALIGDDPLTLSAFKPDHPLRPALGKLVSRFLPDAEAVFWFRTCQTFGADRGLLFAKYWAKFMRCRAVGHTHIIWFFQSGLREVRAGDEPDWSPNEGLTAGTPADPKGARWSAPDFPRTITCIHPRPTAPDAL